ncbi:MAG: GH3 auxin-responsive promoter family protein, partial [Flavobacteriaceae bacterium]|nr:GH3 auxin-responsive promoter family protein [Flavobacteriaceae bacterium]
RMHDKVEVMGKIKATPNLKFIGRSHYVSDLVGEKLYETQVRTIITDILGGMDHFTFMVPLINTNKTLNYACITSSDQAYKKLQEKMEKSLRKIYHYDQARYLEQLHQLKVYHLPNAQDKFFEFYHKKGLKHGDIKFTSLICHQVDNYWEKIIEQ